MPKTVRNVSRRFAKPLQEFQDLVSDVHVFFRCTFHPVLCKASNWEVVSTYKLPELFKLLDLRNMPCNLMRFSCLRVSQRLLRGKVVGSNIVVDGERARVYVLEQPRPDGAEALGMYFTEKFWDTLAKLRELNDMMSFPDSATTPETLCAKIQALRALVLPEYSGL